MNYKMMGRFVAQILIIAGVFMLPALAISVYCGETAAVYAFLLTLGAFAYSAELLSEVIIGGTGSLTGSVIGAAFLSMLPEAMRNFATYRMLAYSVVLVLVMLFRPGGIFGHWEFSLTRLLEKLFRREKVKEGA